MLIEATESFDEPKVEVHTEPKAAKPRRKQERTPTAETGLGKLVLGLLSDGSSWEVGAIGAYMSEAGYRPTSARVTCSRLIKEGRLKHVARGTYALAENPSAQQAAA